MTSNAGLVAWESKHARLLRKGRVGAAGAREKLDLARRNLQRARESLDRQDDDQALIHAETAMVNATDAVLAAHGYRLRGKTGSHEARLECPVLPPRFTAAHNDIEAARDLRNTAMYDRLGAVSPQVALDVTEAADRLVAAAEPLVR